MKIEICHLPDQFLPQDIFSDVSSWVEETQSEGIHRVLSVAITLDDLPRLSSISRQYPGFIDISAGIHPSDVQTSSNACIQALRQWVLHERVVAIGEIGLDYFYTKEYIQKQQWAFEAQMQVAKETGLPVIIHTRDAVDDTLAILKQFPTVKGVLHCFTESFDMAEAAMNLGYMISFSGIITFKKAAAIREVVQQVPMSHLLIETDSPYLAPVPHRGRVNQPKWVKYVGEEVARIHHRSLEEVAAITTQNYYRLFHPNVSYET